MATSDEAAWGTFLGPDERSTRRVLVFVRVFDSVESRYKSTGERTWIEKMQVIDYDDIHTFSPEDFLDEVLAGVPSEPKERV